MAAEDDRVHFFKSFSLAVKNANTRWPIAASCPLKTRKSMSSADTSVGKCGTLSTIDHNTGPNQASSTDNLPNWIHSSQHIRHTGDRDDASPFREY